MLYVPGWCIQGDRGVMFQNYHIHSLPWLCYVGVGKGKPTWVLVPWRQGFKVCNKEQVYGLVRPNLVVHMRPLIINYF